MSDIPESFEFPDEMHERFLFFAAADLQTAERALQPPGVFWHEPCFLARKPAEKALKAFLVAAGKEAPELHSLRTLCADCASVDKEFRRLMKACETLNRYQSEARYPAGGYPFTPERAHEAVSLAREIFDTVRAKIEQRKRDGLL